MILKILRSNEIKVSLLGLTFSQRLAPHYGVGDKRVKVLVILLTSHVWYTSHRYAVATWTEFNHTQAAAVAEEREGGGGWTIIKTTNQNNKYKHNARDKQYCSFFFFLDRDSREWTTWESMKGNKPKEKKNK